MKKIPVIPDCYKDLPDNTLMNSREVSLIFMCHATTVPHVEYKRGVIPKPDKYISCSMASGQKRRAFWKLGTIRKWKNDNSI